MRSERRGVLLLAVATGSYCLASAAVLGQASSTNQLRPWLDYRTIMWVGDSAYKDPGKIPLFFQRLGEMGVNTAMVHGDADPRPLLENQFPFYVENIVNRGLCLKWNSKVQDWDKFVTLWAKEGRQDAGLIRDYCLDDPDWRAWGRREVQRIVSRNRDHHPLAYNLRDELSTTFSANPFDYDFSPIALAGFRRWLQTRYPSLAVLNSEWDTKFSSWDDVRPFTTDQIKNRMASGESLPRGKPDWQVLQQLHFDPVKARAERARWNFSPWADFRTYMDISLAGALEDFRRTARELDPRTPVGIEGTQMPSAFGGYDLWRLSRVLDWVEPYDIGNGREILGSFMPGKVMVTTVFENDTNHALRRLWHLLLEGDRGCIIWWSEDCLDWKSENYKLASKAEALAPALKEMTSPLARLFLRAEREIDPVYIHYSQPSIQVDWLLESTIDGSTWLRRFSSYEADHNQMAKTRNSWLKAFQDMGFSPKFISSEQIENGELDRETNAVLVLADSMALSDKESSGIIHFLQHTGGGKLNSVFCDGMPGLFDEHGKLRSSSPFEDWLRANSKYQEGLVSTGRTFRLQSADGPEPLDGSIRQYGLDRHKPNVGGVARWLTTAGASARSPISVPVSACVRIHRYQLRDVKLLAFERNIDYQMSEELKQAGGNESFEKIVELDAVLPTSAHVYELRSQKYLGYSDRIHFELSPWKPALFALTHRKVQEGGIIAELQR